MSRLLLMALLIAGCSGDGTGSGGSSRYVLYVQGDQTGTPGPYCLASMSSPALLSVHSKAGVTDSAVATNLTAGRYRLSFSLDYYDGSGSYVQTIHSGLSDSTTVPGSILFIC